MSSNKKMKFKKIFTPSGAGCGCGPKSTDFIFEPKPKAKAKAEAEAEATFFDRELSHFRSSSSSWERYGGEKPITDGEDDNYTSTTFSLNSSTSPQFCPLHFHDLLKHNDKIHSKTVSSGPKILDCFAVVKDSDDPYLDFRQSMIQMIFEKEIYSRNDLQQLLDCFLQLNSPRHHEIIVQAFMEIWNGGVSAAADTVVPSRTGEEKQSSPIKLNLDKKQALSFSVAKKD